MEKILEVVRIKQVVREMETEKIRSPHDVAKLAMNYIGDEDREVLLSIALNTKNDVIAIHRVSVGSINSSIVSPREVMKMLILNNASSYVLAHNHPSYTVTPSPEDLEVTDRMKKVGELMGIELIDHLIVTPTNYLSLKEKGYI